MRDWQNLTVSILKVLLFRLQMDFLTSAETNIRFDGKNIMNMKHWNEVLAFTT